MAAPDLARQERAHLFFIALYWRFGMLKKAMLLAAVATTGLAFSGGCGFGGDWTWIAVGLGALVVLGGGSLLGGTAT
jgi:hypothetical protein